MENKKVCKACLEEKELDEFIKDKYMTDGYCSKCKICKKNNVPVDKTLYFKTCNICGKEKECRGFIKNTNLCRVCNSINSKKPTGIIKKCTLCNISKDQINFNKDKYSSDGYTASCKICRQDKVRVVEEDISTGFKTCTGCNILKPLDCYGKDKDTKHGISARCKNCSAEYRNKPEQKEKRRLYRESTKEYMREYLKEYNIINNERLSEQKRLYYTNNKKAINDFKKEWSKKQRNSNYIFKLSGNLRHNISEAIKRKKLLKNTNTLNILGCSLEEFKNHIESQFLPWMSWDNYGNVCGTELEHNCSWDLDHIIPVTWAKTEDELLSLNHWSNFQPLCSKINRDIKKSKVYPCCNIELNITVY